MLIDAENAEQQIKKYAFFCVHMRFPCPESNV